MDEFVSLSVGLLAPLIVSYLKGSHWPDAAKVGLSLLVCIVLGALVSVTTNALVLGRAMTPSDWAKDAALIFSSATAQYKLWFARTDVNWQLEQAGPFPAPVRNWPEPPAPSVPRRERS